MNHSFWFPQSLVSSVSSTMIARCGVFPPMQSAQRMSSARSHTGSPRQGRHPVESGSLPDVLRAQIQERSARSSRERPHPAKAFLALWLPDSPVLGRSSYNAVRQLSTLRRQRPAAVIFLAALKEQLSAGGSPSREMFRSKIGMRIWVHFASESAGRHPPGHPFPPWSAPLRCLKSSTS